MGPADSRGISRVPRYSGTAWSGDHGFAYGALTLCGRPFQGRSATVISSRRRRPYYPGRGLKTAPVWALARSLAATGAIVVTFFSCGYLDVSVPRVRPALKRRGGIAAAGLPHSEIRGSQGICPSPRLIAACHVLRRLREPQASPARLCPLSSCLSL